MSSANARIPSYRHHKPTGQAVVTLDGRDHYLGRFGTAASRKEYKRVVAEWLAREGMTDPSSADLSIVELIAHYWRRHVHQHYVKEGLPTSEQSTIKSALRIVKELYGGRPAIKFGPLALKAVRRKMIDAGWCRSTINSHVVRIRRMFRWAVSEELLPETVHRALLAVQGLEAGRSEAVEPAPVGPVADSVVSATLPYLPPVVADMVRLQSLCGCRPQEICLVRPCDVDTDGLVWSFRPARHKTQHVGRDRMIFFGPKAQEILRPYLLREKSAYCFAPAESEMRRRATIHEARVTPLRQGNRPGTNRRRKPKRTAGRRYTTASYRRAISRAVQVVNCKRQREGEPDAKSELLPLWTPNQLRHAAATKLRRRFGIEAAQTVLGHANPLTTLIYAEADLARAAAVMNEVG